MTNRAAWRIRSARMLRGLEDDLCTYGEARPCAAARGNKWKSLLKSPRRIPALGSEFLQSKDACAIYGSYSDRPLPFH